MFFSKADLFICVLLMIPKSVPSPSWHRTLVGVVGVEV